MRVNSQAEMEQISRHFIDRINTRDADTMCGLIKPSFVSCDYEEKSLTMSYPAQSWERNPLGAMQGGVVATLLDFTVGSLAISFTVDKPVTVSIQVSYLAPAPITGNVLVKARATRVGKTLIHAFAEAWAEDKPEKIVATCNCVYMAV